MNCSPKFTQPLMDRSVIAGYSTAISCSVRGYPKVGIACSASVCFYLLNKSVSSALLILQVF